MMKRTKKNENGNENENRQRQWWRRDKMKIKRRRKDGWRRSGCMGEGQERSFHEISF